MRTELKLNLRASPVVVQTGEAGEVLFGDGGSRLGCNQTVGVGRVSYNQNLKIHAMQDKFETAVFPCNITGMHSGLVCCHSCLAARRLETCLEIFSMLSVFIYGFSQGAPVPHS